MIKFSNIDALFDRESFTVMITLCNVHSFLINQFDSFLLFVFVYLRAQRCRPPLGALCERVRNTAKARLVEALWAVELRTQVIEVELIIATLAELIMGLQVLGVFLF